MLSLGIDVSKRTLSCALGNEVREFANNESGHEALLHWARDANTWCLEATGRYHLPLANKAHAAGKRLLVVNPGLARMYLGFVASRAKTDTLDALALARLAEREGADLREYKPVPEPVALARDIMVRRKALVEARVSLELVAETAGDPEGLLKKTTDAMKLSEKELDAQLTKILKNYEGYKNLLTIPGIGPLSAAVLVCTLERGEFLTSDSLVAFAGLDPRARDSGAKRGKRMLSHQGDAQLRTILYMAAKAGARLDVWKPYYTNQRAKGLSSTESYVILARKLLRVAWSVYKQKGPFIQKNGPTIDNPT